MNTPPIADFQETAAIATGFMQALVERGVSVDIRASVGVAMFRIVLIDGASCVMKQPERIEEFHSMRRAMALLLSRLNQACAESDPKEFIRILNPGKHELLDGRQQPS